MGWLRGIRSRDAHFREMFAAFRGLWSEVISVSVFSVSSSSITIDL